MAIPRDKYGEELVRYIATLHLARTEGQFLRRMRWTYRIHRTRHSRFKSVWIAFKQRQRIKPENCGLLPIGSRGYGQT